MPLKVLFQRPQQKRASADSDCQENGPLWPMPEPEHDTSNRSDNYHSGRVAYIRQLYHYLGTCWGSEAMNCSTDGLIEMLRFALTHFVRQTREPD